MELSDRPPPKHSISLLSVERIKAGILAADPSYGDDLTERDWEQVTRRLEDLARPLWRISLSRVRRLVASFTNSRILAGQLLRWQPKRVDQVANVVRPGPPNERSDQINWSERSFD